MSTGFIESPAPNGRITARLNNDRRIECNATEHCHFDHSYAVTGHSSQNTTSEPALVHADTGFHPGLLNSRFDYVSVSRSSYDTQFYTNDTGSLGENHSREKAKTSAVEFATSHAIHSNSSKLPLAADWRQWILRCSRHGRLFVVAKSCLPFRARVALKP
jgi:hypothetical protein